MPYGKNTIKRFLGTTTNRKTSEINSLQDELCKQLVAPPPGCNTHLSAVAYFIVEPHT